MYNCLLSKTVSSPCNAAAVVAVGGGEEGGLAELLAEGLAGQVVVGHLGHVPAISLAMYLAMAKEPPSTLKALRPNR